MFLFAIARVVLQVVAAAGDGQLGNARSHPIQRQSILDRVIAQLEPIRGRELIAQLGTGERGTATAGTCAKAGRGLQ